MKYLIILVFIFSCASPSNFKKDIEKLKSAPINFPNNLKLLNEHKLKQSSFKKDNIKFVYYLDSVECSSCAINKMYTWQSYINYANNILKNKLDFYFIFAPSKSDLSSLLVSVKAYDIEFPIYIDYEYSFFKANPNLSSKKELHAFLLDKSNNVIVVGDPRYNKEIEKLFYKKTQELLSK